MNKHEEKLENMLKGLGDMLRSQPSVVKDGMQAIEQVKQVKHSHHFASLPVWARSGIGLAACLLIGACLWFSIAGPMSITLADVEKSIDSKTWVLIEYDDGAREWANLPERRSFYTSQDTDGSNFYTGMRDHVQGVWRYYHSNWGRQVHEKPFTPRPYPQTPWEYAVDGWDNQGVMQSPRVMVEKFPDTIDDRQVVRFDTYNIGPLEIRCLVRQVWADPETRLPIRIRKFSGPDRRNEIKTGDFSFPQKGPSSIYDLGAPQGLPLVVNWGIMNPDARTIVDAAEKACHNLPKNMRIVTRSKYSLSIVHRCGDKLRSVSYGLTTPEHNNPLELELPKTNQQISQWASKNLILVDLCIFDGQYEYSYNTGKGLWESGENPGYSLSVRRRDSDWIDVLIPIRDQWPYISNVGPMRVIADDPAVPSGCVMLKYEGSDLQRHWYVDPECDYICVKQSEFRKDQETGQWVKEDHGQTERTDLTRLPSGQWYAGTIMYPEILRATTRLEIELLTDADIERLTGKDDPTDFFDGEKLLKDAMDKKAKVTFW